MIWIFATSGLDLLVNVVRHFRLAHSLYTQETEATYQYNMKSMREILKFHVCNFVHCMSLILKPDIPELSCAAQNNDINPTQYTVQPSYMKGSNSNWNSGVLT